MVGRNLAKFRGKYWCFTINNPIDDQDPPNIWPDVQYVIWQFEAGEEGTQHIQGYVCFTKTKMLSWIKEHTVYAAHWEPRSGKHSEAKHYCMKPVQDCDCKHCIAAIGQRICGPWEHGSDEGISEGQGERSDMDHCKDMIDEGATDLQLFEEHFGTTCRNYRAFNHYRAVRGSVKVREWITKVTVLWGPPGIGKSRRARHMAGPDAYWLPQPEGPSVYWDDYCGQECVVIDEFYGWIKRTQMQKLCDSTPTRVNFKFGSTQFLAKRLIITSNDPPSQWWKNIGLGPMERRLEGEHGEVIHMTAPWAVDAPPATPAVDMQHYYAIFGTPNDGPNEPQQDPLEQDPLSRCPGCMMRTELPQLCEGCLERMHVDNWDF